MYNIKVVSKMIDVPAVTLRAWERRYDLKPSARTQGGHRLYSEQDIEALKWIKHQLEHEGLTISQAVVQLKQKQAKTSKSLPHQVPHQFTDIEEVLYQHLISFEGEKATETVESSFSLYRYDQIFMHVLVPLMHRIGHDWAAGRITVAQEHYATQFLIQRCYMMLHVFPTYPFLPSFLALCPQGEHHQVGLLLFTLFLRQKGVKVIYLGPNMPCEGLDEIIVKHHIQFVAMSLTISEYLPEALTTIETLQNQFKHLSFALGGHGFKHVDKIDQKWLVGEQTEEWEKWFESVLKRVEIK
ncbi:MerR family transcriptional regulator [Hazenella sp. IB182357]|uniref:MerR family transcriptional regulator n=1 Tax=Polycladospora coralii TaxID=2771432 RepID=A0A926NCW9_9BACL|nr:MerR family transcriptional regulator [Polycladospora coralii]